MIGVSPDQVPELAVNVFPTWAVPVIAGNDVLLGATFAGGGGGGVADDTGVTMTSCSTVAVRPRPSVTVSRTDFVPALVNVNTSVFPLPSGELVPPGPSEPSSSQAYVHGFGLQLPVL